MARRNTWSEAAWILGFAGLSLLMLVPLLFMLSTSLKHEQDVYEYPIRLIPASATFEHYVDLFTRPGVPMLRWFFNSAYITFMVTGLVLLIDSLTAFGFSRLDIPYKRPLFILVIASMMIPFPTTLIPVYVFLQQLHWIDTYKALIIPPLAAPFGVFLLRQFFDTVPKELEEAAIIDGCSAFGVYWHVILPVSKSVMATLGIFVFMGTWNAFLWPLIVTHSLKMRPIPVGLTLFNGEFWAERALTMAGATVCALPVLIAFLIFQRHIVRGITLTGLKA